MSIDKDSPPIVITGLEFGPDGVTIPDLSPFIEAQPIKTIEPENTEPTEEDINKLVTEVKELASNIKQDLDSKQTTA